MALPASGQLSISDIATEFSDSAPYSLSEFYRSGGLVPDSPTNSAIPTSGQIAVGDFYGATNVTELNLAITASTQNYDVFTQASADPGYAAGGTDVILTISPGVLVGSSSTGTYALSVPSSFTAGDSVTIVNNGVVIGRGGNGGQGRNSAGGQPLVGYAGSIGGNAVYINFPTTITNNGTLAGGGAGGGSGGNSPVYASGSPDDPSSSAVGGGGGGGGAGYSSGSGGPASTAAHANDTYPGGAGAAGTPTAGGAGGTRGGPYAGLGGAGGGRGANGTAGGNAVPGGGLGGAGGTRGYYLVGNPLVTYPATGTRTGLVS